MTLDLYYKKKKEARAVILRDPLLFIPPPWGLFSGGRRGVGPLTPHRKQGPYRTLRDPRGKIQRPPKSYHPTP